MKKLFTLFAITMMAVTSASADANYLCFTAQEANSSVTFMWNQGSDVQTSTDGTTFTAYTAGTSIPLAQVGAKVYFKGTNVATGTGSHFTMTGKIAASGDVTSLTNGTGGDATLAKMCYYGMFNGCTSLTTAPALPSTTLAYACYANMFQDCTSLTTAPALPATTLAIKCYDSMFYGCKSLTTAPALPATTLVYACYTGMFRDCTSLTTAPALPATTLTNQCYQNMFWNCTSLTTTPELPATKLTSSCYSGMFRDCTSLTSAPALSATTLAEYCYNMMFYGCTALTTAPALPATLLTEACYSLMFYGCTALTTAPTIQATTLAKFCCQDMFNGCTALTTAPTLPATTLAQGCYLRMFEGCSSLNKVIVNFTDWNTSGSATTDWLKDVAATGTFYGPTTLTIPTTRTVSDVPTGWTEKTIAPAVVTAIVKIYAIGTVEYTEACKAKIDAARAAYDALTPEQKALVPAADLKTLTDAEAKYAALEEANSGKFTVTTTFENADGTSKETIKASVDKDFVVKVTLPAKDVKMYANKVTATATMKGITGFGMKADETRTHSKTVTSDRAESIVLSDEIQHVYEFEGVKHFDVKVGDVDKFEYAVKFATEADGTKTITATPSDAALAHKAWTEITSRLDAKTLDSKATGCVMKAGSYVKNNNEMIKFTKDATFTGENLRQNLETLNLATCAYSIAEIKAVEFALAPESNLTIGQTSLTLKPEKAITVTVANDDKTAYVPGTFLTDMKKDLISLVNIASDSEMKKQLIKNVLGYMKTIDSAVSGKRNVTVTVSFDAATAISNVNASTSSAQADGKFIENGRVVIVKNGMKFNANGQRLK